MGKAKNYKLAKSFNFNPNEIFKGINKNYKSVIHSINTFQMTIN